MAGVSGRRAPQARARRSTSRCRLTRAAIFAKGRFPFSFCLCYKGRGLIEGSRALPQRLVRGATCFDMQCGDKRKKTGLTAMAKAMWNGQLLAESETTETVEGNLYFPEESVQAGVFTGEFHHFELPMEGPGALLHRAGRRSGKSRRRVVLPGSEACGAQFEASRGVLARR